MRDRPTFIDYYRILQVHQDAEPEIIKSAYRRLAQLNHPDVQPGSGSLARMQEINEAYAVIADPGSRRPYHQLWLDHQLRQARAPRSAGTVSPAAHPADQASQVLDAYFRHLLADDWQQAYALLTRHDQAMVSLADFCAWKNAVKALYQMGSYVIKPFRSYEHCVVGQAEYACLHVFSVFLTDRDTRTGAVTEETYTKHVVLDRDEWRICLGYTDLKPVICNLKYLAAQAPVLDVSRVYADILLKYDRHTGFYSRKGLSERLEQEIARMRRSHGHCCLAVLSTQPCGGMAGISQSDYAVMCLVQAARQLGETLRSTDLAARLTGHQLAVLLVDTDQAAADTALSRFLRAIRPSDGLDYRLYGSLTPCTLDLPETLLLQAEHDAMQAAGTQAGQSNRHVPLDSQQV